MENYPYQSPKSHIAPVAHEWIVRPLTAGKGVRFLNLLIDYATFFTASMVLGFLIGLSGQQDLLRWVTENETLYGFILIICYYLATEGLFARSVGKFITGCKVVDEKGGRPSFMQIVGRTFSRLIPFDALSFLGGNGRGMHDSIPRTYVVLTR